MDRVEVVLRDLDGSRTIFPASLPLGEVIHSGQTDMEIIMPKAYVRTDQKDEHGRIIYVEQN